MEKMMGRMMEGCCNNLSEEDKLKMQACFEKMAVSCPCGMTEDQSETGRKAMTEQMMCCCGDKKGMMQSFMRSDGPVK